MSKEEFATMAKDTYKKVPVIKELAEPEEEGAD